MAMLLAGLALLPRVASGQEQPAAGCALRFITLVEVGAQLSRHDALAGTVGTGVLGLGVGAPSAHRQDYMEVGITRLEIQDAGDTTSSVMIGARSIWSWSRWSLHVSLDLHHGDPVAGNSGVRISSFSMSLGGMASFDLVHRSQSSLALGVFGRGRLYDATDGGDETSAAAGSFGLAFVVH